MAIARKGRYSYAAVSDVVSGIQINPGNPVAGLAEAMAIVSAHHVIATRHQHVGNLLDAVQGVGLMNKLLYHLQAKAALLPQPKLMAVTRVSHVRTFFALLHSTRIPHLSSPHITATELNRSPGFLLHVECQAPENAPFQLKNTGTESMICGWPRLPEGSCSGFLP